MKTMINYLKAILASIWTHIFAGKGELRFLLDETAKVIPQALPNDVCQQLVEKIEAVLSDSQNPRVWRDKVGSDSRIWRFEQEIQGVEGVIDTFEIKRWVKAIDEYTGKKTRSWCLMANRVLPVEGNLGSGGGMHRDSPFSHQVKCIWYLNDVGGSNGPFQYLPGTNVNLIRDRGRYALGENRFHEINEGATEVKAKAGSLLLCDTKCIHGGKPIQRGVRYAITLYTFNDPSGVNRIMEKSGLNQASA